MSLSRRSAIPLLTFAASALAMILLPLLFGGSVSSINIYNVGQTFADYGLVALAIGLALIIAEYDLSIASVYGLSGIVAVKLGVASPLVGVLAGIGVGIAACAIQGIVVAVARISSLPVTLGGYLTVAGLSLTITHAETVDYANIDAGFNLDRPILEVFSLRSLITAAVFVLAALAMHFTRTGRDVRSVGGDRRASRTAGVPVRVTIIGVFAVAGACSALAGAMASYSLASASPNVGLGPLIFGTIAALLGGVKLSGGQGSALGIAAGVLAFAGLDETLAIVGAPDYVTALVTGTVLIVVTIASAPDLARTLRARRTRLQTRSP
jgi:ribose transport system permease protein